MTDNMILSILTSSRDLTECNWDIDHPYKRCCEYHEGMIDGLAVAQYRLEHDLD